LDGIQCGQIVKVDRDLIIFRSANPFEEPKIRVLVEDPENLEYTVRESGEFIYILAARREGPTAQASFSGLPGVSRGEVLFENLRPIQVEQGRFTDWFGPNELHIYRFRRSQAR
jgi:hypothetical protein